MAKELFEKSRIWFITGSQDLYGEETLRMVAEHSKEMVRSLNASNELPVEVVWKPVVLTGGGIAAAMSDANGDSGCLGVITWMHTFSPAKMWIRGLSILSKPLLHLHTQFNRDIPWDSIDMDFMNLNQSAHGDREYGYIGARLGIRRRVVAGYWQDGDVRKEIAAWMRSAVGKHEAEHLCVARFGDNMRHVAVTEGDKVEAQITMGIQVDGYGIGDLVESVQAVSSSDLAELMDEYGTVYSISDEIRKSDDAMNAITEQARIELGMKNFLDAGGYGAFTTTFENLYGLPQLPGLAVQRLMARGYGFGAEGDWKHSALVRIMKRMAAGLPGGTSFMEDYTYNMDPEDPMVLGAHMLEVCPSVGIKDHKPSIQVHPLGIGGKNDPARLVFDGERGEAINVSLVDMGNRLRLIVNEVSAIRPVKAMPKLPVARVLWRPKPDFKTALEGWIHAGGAHHTCFTTALGAEHIEDFAVMTGMELIRIGEGTTIRELKKDLLMSDLSARL